MEASKNQYLDIYQLVTDQIIAQLEKEIVPWRKPWTSAGPPANLLTKRPYQGINILLLNSFDYASNYFLSWKQLKVVGGSVLKGEKGHMVIFWKRLPVTETNKAQNNAEEYKYVLRYYKVFNLSQCKGIPEHLVPDTQESSFAPNTTCDEIIERMPNCPTIKHAKQKAYYDVKNDVINMPKQGSFESTATYYSTLFHELVHSTGHATRLNRKEITEPNDFGSDMYSIEELTAEIGTTFLQSIAGIHNETFSYSVSYIQSWLKQLRNDKKFIIKASSRAQRAVEYMLNVTVIREEDVLEETVETQ